MKPVRSALLMALLLGCGHSEPFASPATGSDVPFGDSSPYQLTFNPGDDEHPAVSNPGELSYQFQRGTPDRDFCAAILPTSGGSRTVELCAHGDDDPTRSDLFANLVRLGDGNLVWTHHWGATGNQSPQSGGLYLGGKIPTDSAIRVLQLLARPAGASARWDQLVDPIRTGPAELTVLAVQWIIGPLVQYGPDDTLTQGVEIVRIDLATNPATVTPITPAPEAFGWARDPMDGAIYFGRQSWVVTATGRYRTFRDTVFAATIEGGQPVWSWSAGNEYDIGRLDGFTAVNGRLFIARQSTSFVPGPTGPVAHTISLIAEVVGGIEQNPISVIDNGPSIYWGQLAATSDGQALIAELVSPEGKDLYRLDLTP